MISLRQELKNFVSAIRAQDFGFHMAAAYMVFSYLRPQEIYPALGFLPWTQLSILGGLIFAGMKGYIRFQSSHTSVLLLFAVALISCYQSYYSDYSFSKIDVIIIWLLEMIFFTSCIRTQKQLQLITIVFFIVLFKISFFGARTWVQRGFGFRDYGIAGPSGFFANSGELSLLMAMLAVLSIAFLLGHKPIRRVYFLLPLTAIMTVLAASSRGGQLALACGLLLIMVIIGKLRIKNVVLVVALAFAGLSLLPDEQKQRFSSMGEDNTSASRLLYWEKGIEMANEHPFFGIGYYAFPLYFRDHYSYLLDEDSFLGGRSEVAHNSLVQIGSTMGYIGLACYLYMHALCLSLTRKARKNLQAEAEKGSALRWTYLYSIGLDISLVTYFIGAFFMSVAFYPYIYLQLMFSQSLYNSSKSIG